MAEISDQELQNSINILPYESITEKVNFEPQIKLFPKSHKTTIEIGNTGFSADYIYDQYGKPLFRFDYTPEGKLTHNEENKARNAVILGTALLELRNFTSNSNNLEKNHISKFGIVTLETLTNPHLAESLVRLFSSHGHPELASTDLSSYGTDIILDWEGFEKLNNTDNLIVYLNKLKSAMIGDAGNYSDISRFVILTCK